MSEERVVYSIQRTYIIKSVSKSEKRILTCDERIDIPTIEPLPSVKPFLYDGQPLTVIPCIELSGEFWSEYNLTFETNEGVTVLPVRIAPASQDPFENPYVDVRYVLALPRGATGVRTCKLIHRATGKEVQHNLTFCVMPPPYNYDNILFGCIMNTFDIFGDVITDINDSISRLKLTKETPTFAPIDLPKGAGKQTINIEDGVLFYKTGFSYTSSEEPTIHKPKITLRGGGYNKVYTLSLNKTKNVVSIDLFTGMIRVCDVNGEIIQQFMINLPNQVLETLSFENFDDINSPSLIVYATGARVK